MRILLLQNNINNLDTLNKGVVLVTKYCATIGLPLTFIPQVTNRQFTSLPFSNNTNKNGYQVNPREIFEECAKVNFKFDSDSVVCLVYDSLKITPNPTNPIDDGLCMQIPQNWFNSPEVFAQYFLHEISHYYSALKGVKDMTHLMTDMTLDPVTYLKFAQKQPQDYYLYLLSTLIKPMPTVPTYKYFSKKEVDTFKLKPELFAILDSMREIASVPFKITSGLRTPEENFKVGGVANSSHLKALGVDIACTNLTRQAIMRGILNCGTPVFTEDCPNHIHIDIDSSIHKLGTGIVSQNG